MEEIERVEELFLGSFLPLHELDVVNEQHIAVVAIATLEGSRGVRFDGVDELGDKCFGRHIADPATGVVLSHVVGNGLQEV